MRGALVVLAAGALAACGGPGAPPSSPPPSAIPISGAVSSTVPGTADPNSGAEPQPVASLPPGANNPGASGFTTADPLSTHPGYGNAGFGLRRYR